MTQTERLTRTRISEHMAAWAAWDQQNKPIDPTSLVLVVGEGEWSAAYRDGHLVTYGDHDNVQEQILRRVGVTTHYLDGVGVTTDGQGVTHPTPPATYTEVTTFAGERKARAERAEALRAQAQALLDEADAMDGKVR